MAAACTPVLRARVRHRLDLPGLRRLLLGLDAPSKLLASRRHIPFAILRIDESSVLASRLDSLPELRSPRVRREQDVARQAFEEGEPALEILDGGRVGRAASEVETVRGYGRLTIRIDHIDAALLVARSPRPACSARRVARCEMRGQRERADPQRLPIRDDAHLANRREHRDAAILRITRLGCSPFENPRARRTRGDRCTGRADAQARSSERPDCAPVTIRGYRVFRVLNDRLGERALRGPVI